MNEDNNEDPTVAGCCCVGVTLASFSFCLHLEPLEPIRTLFSLQTVLVLRSHWLLKAILDTREWTCEG